MPSLSITRLACLALCVWAAVCSAAPARMPIQTPTEVPGTTEAQPPAAIPAFRITQPTVIGFFPQVTDAQLDADPDTNEVLSDFQLYAGRAAKPLSKAGVRFEVVSTRAFRVITSKRSSLFKTGKTGVGFYFIAPSKKPEVRIGVMTDDDILETASKYFGLKITP